jgi:hypothetical protein
MSEHASKLVRYKHLRHVGLELNNRLVASLSKNALEEGGKALGILRNGVFVLGNEDESNVLMDYCLHDVREDGINAIERFLAKSPPAPGSDELLILQAKRAAWYSLFVVEQAEPGVGVHVRDLLRQQQLFLTDMGLGSSAPAGAVLASRIMTIEGIHATTGAALPLGIFPAAAQQQILSTLANAFLGADLASLPPEDASRLAAMVIQGCLKSGSADRVRYETPGVQSERRVKVGAVRSGRRIGRNDRCPCGSGRKFKQCCGARS